MWTMTPQGFFSAVQHDDDPALLVIRCRVRADAEFLRGWYAMWRDMLADMSTQAAEATPPATITTYDAADYPWRVIMPRTAYGAFMAESVEDLSYGNFKDAVKDQQGYGRYSTYTQVWWALLDLERQDPASTRGQHPADDLDEVRP